MGSTQATRAARSSASDAGRPDGPRTPQSFGRGDDAGRAHAPFLAGLDRPDPSPASGAQRESAALLRIRAERLVDQGAAVEIFHVLAAALTFGAFAPVVPSGPLAVWLGLVVAVAVVRFFVRLRLRRSETGLSALRLFRGIAVAVGLTWGAGALAFHDVLPTAQFFLLMMIFAGIIAGGTVSLAMDRGSFNALSFTLVGSLVLGLLLKDQLDARWMALGMTLLFLVGMQVLYAMAQRAFFSTILTSFRLERAEKAGMRERAFLDALIWSAPSAIVAVDEDGRVIGVNPAFEALFLYRSSDVIGRTLDELVVPEEQMTKAGELFDRVQHGEVFHQDLERRRADGSLVPVRVSAARVQDVGEGAVFVLYEDRSAEVKANEALREAERHYRALVESSSDLVWTCDRAGRWTFVNAASRQIYGTEPQHLVGTGFGERVTDERREQDIEMIREVLSGAEVSDYETLHVAVDGAQKHLSFSARPVRTQTGEIVGAQGTARDVSERAAVRAALEEARELAINAAHTRSAFLANMSHEIRTPMNGVLGMLEVLLDTELDREQRRATEVIRSSGQALLTLIDDILDVSKLDAGSVEIEEIPFDLKGLVDATIRLLSVDAEKRGLEVTCEFDPRVSHRVSGDPGRVRQILTNLTANAIKFTHEGRIAVSVEPPPPGASADAVHFVVRDTGIGISPEKLDTIFEQFTQADISTTRRYGGSGLGLTICRGLVERMGGQISVTSAEGKGSAFSFWVPLPALEPEAQRTETPTLQGLRALVLDDNAVNRRVLTEGLASAHIRVDAVGHPHAALDRLIQAAAANDGYAFAVIDRQMPEMDGFEFAARVRERSDIADLPLVLLTSTPSQGDGRLCRDLGIGGYLPKPVGRSDLLEAISRMMQVDPGDEGSAVVTRHTISEARRTMSLLLVEDNPLNQEVAVALLERRGHRVQVVDNGLDAVTAVDEQQYDLVLMDIQLPGIDGVEATRRIRTVHGSEELPIVALTAHAFDEERERAMSSGMNGFLSKPFRPHELFALVEGWAKPLADGEEIEAAADGDAPLQGEAEPLVDLEGFRSEMREVGIEHIVEESISMFRSDAVERMAAITEATAVGAFDEVARLAHAFKGGAGTIHANELRRTLEALEQVAQGEDTSSVHEAVGDTRRTLERTIDYLDENIEAYSMADVGVEEA